MLGRMVIAAYRPKAGCDDALLALTREHYGILAGEKLVTKRAPIIMRAKDGTLLEVFEWASADAIDSAHTNPAVLDLWDRYAELCEYVKLSDISESDMQFAEFSPVD